VTVDELFLLTLDDLEERATLGKGEYNLLNMAWLLRKLLLDSEPLVHAVNRSRRLKILYRVNDDGAVHSSPANDPKTEALRDDAWGRRVTTSQGQYSGPVYALRAVAEVTLEALEPLRQHVVKQHVRHDVLPAYTRGLGRHSDPSQR
jgi:hypothetical protein